MSVVDVSNALQHATYLCTLLSNQHGLVRDSFALRIGLLTHLFVRVLPQPLWAIFLRLDISFGLFTQRWHELGPSWLHLGLVLAPLGAILGSSWAVLGPCWGFLEPPWGHLGLSEPFLGATLAYPWTFLRHLGAI